MISTKAGPFNENADVFQKSWDFAALFGPFPIEMMREQKQVLLTQGGKGGSGKTELSVSTVDFVKKRGFKPLLLDFDRENTDNSGLQNFHTEAIKLDVHQEGALDTFFDICDREESNLIIADLPAGAGLETFQFFNDAFEDAEEIGIRFTAIGVVNNDAGTVQSVLKWGKELQNRVDYLIVFNELRERNSRFEYWHDEPATQDFDRILKPRYMKMQARISDLQAEMRNQNTTLQQIIDGDTDVPFFKQTKNRLRAKRYQRELFEGFEKHADILLPPSHVL